MRSAKHSTSDRVVRDSTFMAFSSSDDMSSRALELGVRTKHGTWVDGGSLGDFGVSPLERILDDKAEEIHMMR